MDNSAVGIKLILVPAGAEHWAVKWGLRGVTQAPRIVAIPAGPQGFRTFLETWKDRDCLQAGGVLLVGLGGGLSHNHNVGDVVVLERVWNGFEEKKDEVFECAPELTRWIAERLNTQSGVGVTCDRVITTVQEKRDLCDRYRADVVDMEGVVLLEALSNSSTAIVRVISDNAQHDLPDISVVISPDGSFKVISLALMLLKRPLAAVRFVQGALMGLKALEKIVPLLIVSLLTDG